MDLKIGYVYFYLSSIDYGTIFECFAKYWVYILEMYLLPLTGNIKIEISS